MRDKPVSFRSMLAVLSNCQISSHEKGLGSLSDTDPNKKKWNLLNEDLSLPVAVLYQEKIRHNLEWMKTFIASYHLNLAPHGKTTMAPKLFDMQLKSGAWGITLATAQQTEVAFSHGVTRVLMANQLVGKQNMAKIAALLRQPSFEFFCLVDSCENVAQLGRFFSERSLKLNVLIELGVEGGRAGVRNATVLSGVLSEIVLWRETIKLSGVEIYEGVLKEEAQIRTFLKRAVAVTKQLAKDRRFERDPVILSGAGSAWYDVVAEEFTALESDIPVEIILRPGCYLTHDVGAYETAQSAIKRRNPVAARMAGSLQPALQVWAYVQSIPERGHAIVGLGKRDAAFDAGLPKPVLHFTPGELAPEPLPPSWKLTTMMDQHAYLELPITDSIQVGDMIGFDISHPCLTFDKWRVIPVLDESYQVVDFVKTYF